MASFNSDWLKANQEPAAEDASATGDQSWKFWQVGGESGSEGSLLPTFNRGEEDQGMLEVSRSDRFKGFVICILCAAFFFLLGFFIGLPMIVLRPAKFAFCSTMGMLLFMAGIALLQGPASYCGSICSRARAPYTAAFFGSMFATLYSSLFMRSYLLTVAASGLQMAALGWHLSSAIPGGKMGMYMMTKAFLRAARAMLGPCFALTKTTLIGCLKAARSGSGTSAAGAEGS